MYYLNNILLAIYFIDISDQRMIEVMESINSEFFGLVELGDTPSVAYNKMVKKNSYRIFAEPTSNYNEPMSAEVSLI